MQQDLLTFALVKLLIFAPFFNTQKSLSNYFALEMAAVVVARRRHRREQRARGRRERISSTHIHLFGKNTLSKHIVCQAMLFLVCTMASLFLYLRLC